MLLSVASKKRKTSSALKPGLYHSVVVDINFHPDYCLEEALLVKYQLTDENGKIYSFSEIFFNKENNERTQNFYDYLVENGIPLEVFTSFNGCQETLTIKKTVRNQKTMLTIANRQFVAHGAGNNNAVPSNRQTT